MWWDKGLYHRVCVVSEGTQRQKESRDSEKRLRTASACAWAQSRSQLSSAAGRGDVGSCSECVPVDSTQAQASKAFPVFPRLKVHSASLRNTNQNYALCFFFKEVKT